MDAKAADHLAAQLQLDVDDVAICHACLSFVSMAIDGGEEAGGPVPSAKAAGSCLPSRRP